MTESGVRACYAAVGVAPPHKLAVDVASTAKGLKVKRLKTPTKVRQCVVSIIETVNPPNDLAAATMLHYKLVGTAID